MPDSESNASAWRVQADTYPNMDFAGYRRALIHETNKIKMFLSETRGEHFIISAPRGFGKTLLLIAKKMQLLEHRGLVAAEGDYGSSSVVVMGHAGGGEVVDRLTVPPPTFSKERINRLKNDYDFWKSMWWISFMLSALKIDARATKRDLSGDVAHCGKFLREIVLHKEQYFIPTSIFQELLSADFREQQDTLKDIRSLNALLATIRTQALFFIDNVDEYLKPYQEDHGVDRYLQLQEDAGDDSQYRTRSNELWSIAQIALVGAAHAIHKTNSHISVYCTVRREAFLELDRHEPDYQMIVGSTIEIEYNKRDLAEIFKKNIGLMPEEQLHGSKGDDLMQRFFGTTTMRHRFVEGAESAFDYVLRHTFYRPRDLMMIGSQIAIIDPQERTPDNIRDAVDQVTDDLVKGLAKEMSPFFALPNIRKLASCITKNVMTYEELGTATRDYVQKTGASFDEDDEYSHPFCVLYKIGMLGWIITDFSKGPQAIQRFVLPREISMRNHTGLPVTERVFLIHPALDHLIAVTSGGREFFKNFDRSNIIGNGLKWFATGASSVVLKGDVCSFSEIMTTDYYEDISKNLHEWAETACRDLEFSEVSGGDSIVMIDRSADRVIRAADAFLRLAKACPDISLTLRFGGAVGPVNYRDLMRRIDGKWEKIRIPTGLALRTSARLEPHAREGEIIVDEKFAELVRSRPNGFSIDELGKADLNHLTFDDDKQKFVVQKNAHDPGITTKLYRVTATAGSD